jgi:hypothetical protein
MDRRAKCPVFLEERFGDPRFYALPSERWAK